MDRFDRIYQLHRILDARRQPISGKGLQKALGCSRATLNRTISAMRLFLNAPIEYDHDRGGYFYGQSATGGMWALPGLWFSAEELQALLTLEHLLSALAPGFLAQDLQPFRQRIQDLLARREVGTESLYARLRILGMGMREVDPLLFRTVASAVGGRARLKISYRSRSDSAVTDRDVSPQSLVHYRENWYLVAWCHLREDTRLFSLDRIEEAQALEEPALELDSEALDVGLEGAYGIFLGAPRATAVLSFSERTARWVSEERWHPDQQGRWTDDGTYELEVPYADPTELIRDILRYGPDVEVLAPPALREQVAVQLRSASARYETPAQMKRAVAGAPHPAPTRSAAEVPARSP